VTETLGDNWIFVEYDDGARSGVGNDYVAISRNGHAMSQSIPLDSRPLNYWRLSFSIAEAAVDCREAPWYGPWSIAIQQLFENFCPYPFVTITYPQYPVTKDVDSIIPDEEVEDEDNSDGEDEGDSNDEVCHVALGSISTNVIHR
jgi:hypothetical protein